MAVALVQSNSGNAPTNTLAATKAAVRAGDLLLVAALSQGPQAPLALSDGLGNTYNLVTRDYDPYSGASGSLWYAYNVRAGTPSIALPGAVVWAVHEFSGVLATGDPIDDMGSASQVGSTISVPYAFGQAQELFFGVCMSVDNALITLPAFGTLTETQQSDNGSLRAGWGTAPNNRQGGTVTWTQPSAAKLAGYWATFRHS